MKNEKNGKWKMTTEERPSLLPAAVCRLPSAACLLLTANCLLPTASCLLPIAFSREPAIDGRFV